MAVFCTALQLVCRSYFCRDSCVKLFYVVQCNGVRPVCIVVCPPVLSIPCYWYCVYAQQIYMFGFVCICDQKCLSITFITSQLPVCGKRLG